jgi:ATP-binding cassette subfamily C (CFTR/MRP) protein 1
MNHSVSLPCEAAADYALFPAILRCRGGVDFTFTFEQYFLSIIPSAVFLLSAPFRLGYLSNRPKRVGSRAFGFMKLVSLHLRCSQDSIELTNVKLAIGLLASLQLSLIILWAIESHASDRHGSRPPSTPASASSTVSFAASLALGALSHSEHSKTLRSSVLINTYLLLSLLSDAVTLRTLWLMPNTGSAILDVHTALLAVKACVVLLEASDRRKLLNEEDKQRSPEQRSGLYSQVFFWWLNPLIKRGFSTVLKSEDLFSLSDDVTTNDLSVEFWRNWKSCKFFIMKKELGRNPNTLLLDSDQERHSIILILAYMIRWHLWVPVISRLVLIVFTFCQPLLLSRFLDYLQDITANQEETTGYLLIGTYFLVYFGMAVR